MRLHRTAILGVLAAALWSVPALAQAPPLTPSLTQATRNGWLRFQVVAGRISLGSSRLGNINSNSSSSGRTEKLSIRFATTGLSLTYEHSTLEEEFSVEISSGNRISIRRRGKEDSTIVPVEFTQAPNEPIALALGPDGKQTVYRATTLWHLLMAQPEECRQHLIPLLELLHTGWRLAETAAAMETELLRTASAGQLPDYGRWGLLVAQLADQRFSRRQAADRQLRSAGPIVLPYLRRLDLKRLDAEQKFRVRRIVNSLSRQTGEDTAEWFVSQLVADPDIWLALLARREEATRRLAVRQLEAFLGGPIRFDSTADPAVRRDQIEQLRARIPRKRT